MSSTTSSINGAGPGGTAIITTAGGPGGAPPVTIAAFHTDVLIVAVPHGLGAGHCAGGVPARRPVRPQPAAGWAPNLPTLVKSMASQAIASGAAKKTSASTAKKTTTPSAASASKSSSATKSSGPLAFLDDKKLSVEEKLFRFLCYVSDKNDKALEKKMNEIRDKKSETSGSSSSGGKAGGSGGGGGLLGGLLGGGGGGGLLGGLLGGGGGGLLGGLLGGGGGGLLGGLLGGAGGGLSGLLGNVFSGAGMGTDLLKGSGLQDLVSQLAGPVLAAGASVLGFPMLAPVLMQAGPALAKGAMSLMDGGAEQKSSSSKTSSSSSSSTSSSSSKESSSSSSKEGDFDPSKTDLLELERLQDKQKQAFSLISNMLRAMHDTKMAVINNLRA